MHRDCCIFRAIKALLIIAAVLLLPWRPIHPDTTLHRSSLSKFYFMHWQLLPPHVRFIGTIPPSSEPVVRDCIDRTFCSPFPTTRSVNSVPAPEGLVVTNRFTLHAHGWPIAWLQYWFPQATPVGKPALFHRIVWWALAADLAFWIVVCLIITWRWRRFIEWYEIRQFAAYHRRNRSL